jgi:hypothetical protein
MESTGTPPGSSARNLLRDRRQATAKFNLGHYGSKQAVSAFRWKKYGLERIFPEWRRLSDVPIAAPSTDALKKSSWCHTPVTQTVRSAATRWSLGWKAPTLPYSSWSNVQTERPNEAASFLSLRASRSRRTSRSSTSAPEKLSRAPGTLCCRDHSKSKACEKACEAKAGQGTVPYQGCPFRRQEAEFRQAGAEFRQTGRAS